MNLETIFREYIATVFPEQELGPVQLRELELAFLAGMTQMLFLLSSLDRPCDPPLMTQITNRMKALGIPL